jgi:hypothetical protein
MWTSASPKNNRQGDRALPEDAFQIAAVGETNAALVGDVFRAVYGEEFPVKYVYEPELLMREIHSEKLAAVLALDAFGRAAGYVSVYKTAPNPRLWEAGNMIVAPEYKHTHVSNLLANSYFSPHLQQKGKSDGLFGEAVCCHYFSQVGSSKAGLIDCALELDQLDGASFKDNRAGTARVSCVLNFLEHTDPPSPVYVPQEYAGILQKLSLPLRPRVFRPSTAPLSTADATRTEERYYASARTWKWAVWEIGTDWPAKVAELLSAAKQRGVISLQVSLNMACPPIGTAAQSLRSHGFFLGGLLPRWFGSDGLLLQQVFGAETDYDQTLLYTRTAKELLTFIRADRAAVQAAGRA